MFTLTAAAILYTMSASAAAAPEQTTGAESPEGQKIKCRKIEVTGSRTKGKKVCKTVAEWRYLKDRGSDNARDIVDVSRTRPAGN
jgi:hypothetical protein